MREFKFTINYTCGHNDIITLSGDAEEILKHYVTARKEKCSDCKGKDKYVYGLVLEYKGGDYGTIEEVIMISKNNIKDGITIEEIADRFNMSLETYYNDINSPYDCTGQIHAVYATVKETNNYIVIYNSSRLDV